MDIQSEFRRSKIFKTNFGAYDLSFCRWRLLGNQSKKKKQLYNPPTRGYIHGAVTLKNNIYTIIGSDQLKSQPMLQSFNFKTNEWKQWKKCNLPQIRDSFGLTSHKNQVYMIGGSNEHVQFKDIHIFDNLSNEWQLIQQSDLFARNPMVFTDVNNEFILMYGGVNLEYKTILNDAYLYINNQWRSFNEIKNQPSHLVGAKVATCRQKVYLFGGEIGLQNRPNNQLFRLDIDINTETNHFKLIFTQINISTAFSPCPRTAHCMIGINEDYFLIMGGQAIESNNILRDLWLFDIKLQEWSRIDPTNGPLKPICQNSVIMRNNCIYILGGFIEATDTWNEQIISIEFGQSQLFKNEICANCIQRSIQIQKQQKSFPKSLILSNGFFYTISLEIKHPFQALQILYDCSLHLGASKFNISISKSLNQNQHIEIDFDGSTLSKPQFQDFISNANSSPDQFSKFVTLLKIAAFRLGKTFIYITANQHERKVFMFSADSKVVPLFDEDYCHFSYIQNIQKSLIQSHEGKVNRQIILNVMRSRIAYPQVALNITKINKIFIFEKNILITADKVYYYQLIQSNENDISIYKSSKKVAFLQQMGYQLSKQPQLSLRTFFSISRLNMNSIPSIFINNNQVPIQQFNYLQKLKQLEESGYIQSFDVPLKIYDIEIDAQLFISWNQDYFLNNLGILVYHNERLLNRLDCNFGDLFKQEFYKTKYKKANNIFEYLGVINIKKGLSPNYFSNWIKKNRNYYNFIQMLRQSMRKARQEKNERMSKMGIIDDEDNKIQKKIKI